MRTFVRWLLPPLGLAVIVVGTDPRVRAWWDYNGVGIILFHLLLLFGALWVLGMMVWHDFIEPWADDEERQ